MYATPGCRTRVASGSCSGVAPRSSSAGSIAPDRCGRSGSSRVFRAVASRCWRRCSVAWWTALPASISSPPCSTRCRARTSSRSSAGWRARRPASRNCSTAKCAAAPLLRLLDRLGSAPSTPFNQPIGPYRRIDWFSVDLAEVKAIRSVALLSYAGTLSWGIGGDWSQRPDLAEFVAALEESFAELRAAAAEDPVDAARPRLVVHPGSGAATRIPVPAAVPDRRARRHAGSAAGDPRRGGQAPRLETGRSSR